MRAAILALGLVLSLSSRAGARLKLPVPAPALRLVDLDGRKVNLAALQGQVVLVDFWATWCGPCVEQAPRLKALQEKHRHSGLRLIGLSLDDSAAPVEKFRKKLGLNYPVALADVSTTAAFGGVLGLPTLFVIDRKGQVVFERRGEIGPKELDALAENALAQ